MNPKTTAPFRSSFYRVGAAGAMLASGLAQAAVPSSISLSDADASFYGEQELDDSGARVSGVGDVNGDGMGDLLISAPGAQGEAGKVYLVFGRSLGFQPLTSLSLADASFVGEAAGDQAGLSVASAGDFNRDGYGDIAIAAPTWTHSSRGYGAGKVYVIYGKPTGWAKNTPLSSADVSFVGESSLALAGMSVSPLGDINKDGYPDLAVGSPGHNNYAGKVYVVLGGSSSSFRKDMELSAFPSFTGEAANNNAGFSVAGIGDFNGDGYADMLVGAYGNSQKASQAGKTYLIYGRGGTWSKGSPLVQVTSFFLGQSARDYAGYSVAGAGDIDKDGLADFIIGAPGRDKNGDASGAVAVMYGRSGTLGAYDLGQVDGVINGEAAGDIAAASLSGGFDIDNDGYAEVLVSSHYSDRSDVDAGAAFLFRGQRTRMSSASTFANAAAVIIGENALDQAGFSLSSAGDVDGDGFDDLLVAAHGSDVNGAASGMTYLVLMGPLVDLDSDGFSTASGDCNDFNAGQYPGATEIARNGIDENCDGADGRTLTTRK